MKTCVLFLLALTSPAGALVTANAPDGFTSRHQATIAASPSQTWAALTAWHRWWPSAHTYSGTPPILSLKAGGGLVESWAGGEVQHATTVAAMPPKLLRLLGGFGPLQSLPVNAVLDFTLSPEGEATKVVMTYRVAGNAEAELDQFAAPVDSVMGEGFARLTRFAQTGKPE